MGTLPRVPPWVTLVVLLVAMPWFYLATVVGGFRCDESCVDKPKGSTLRPGNETWRDYDSAWQWRAQFAFAAVGLAGAVMARVLAKLDRVRQTWWALACAGFGYSVWTIWQVLL